MMRSYLSALMAILLLFLFSVPVSAQSEQQGIQLYSEGFRIQSKAQTKADIEKALLKYEEALSIFEKTKSSKRIYALNQIGTVYKSLADYPKALEYLHKAVLVKTVGDDKKISGFALNNIGAIYRSMGDYRRAIEYFEMSLPIKKATGDARNEADTLNSIGDCYRSMGDYLKAREYIESSLKMSRKTKDEKGIGESLGNLGNVYQGLSQYAEALDYYDEALKIAVKLGDIRGQASLLNNLAFTHHQCGDYEKALTFNNLALDKARQIGELSLQAATLNNIGIVFKETGRFSQAVDYYEDSLLIQRKIQNRDGEANCLGNIGIVLRIMGQYRKALEKHRECLDIKESIGDLKGKSYALSNIADVYVSTGQYAKALENCNQSLEIKISIGDVDAQGSALRQIGELQALMGRTDDAVNSLKKSLEISHSLQTPTIRSETALANLYLEMGNLEMARSLVNKTKDQCLQGRLALADSNYSSAVTFYEKAISEAKKTKSVDDLFVAFTGAGRGHELLGQFEQSREFYQSAIEITEEIRAGLLPSERRNFFDVRIAGYRRSDPAKGLTRVLMKLNRPEQSIEPGELTKARGFADHLAQSYASGATGVPEEILVQERMAVDSIAALKQELWRSDPVRQPERYANITESVEKKSQELAKIVEDLRKNYPLYAATKHPRPLNLGDSALKPDEYAVLFDVSQDGVAVRLVQGQKLLKSLYVDSKQTDLEKFVKKFRAPLENLRFAHFDHETGRKLYDSLLREVMEVVPKGSPIIIVPDGPLSVLPFEALVTGGSPQWQKSVLGFPTPLGLTYLGDEHPITYYQALTTVTLVRSFRQEDVRGKKIAVIADPVFEMNDIRAQHKTPTNLSKEDIEYTSNLMAVVEETSMGSFHFTRLEATSILAENLARVYSEECTLLLGLDANKSEFMDRLAPSIDRFASLVFATHGAMSSRIPGLMEPFLALTMVPPGTDGFLKMSDILKLKMNADIVALTACQTALGEDISGEGVMSMGRAFQFAGSKSVLMTLWEVEEASAIKLTESLLKYRKDGRTKLEALQLARNDIRKAGYEHPYFWSGFVLVGETQ